MKLTTLICCSFLALIGILASFYALSGFDLLLFFCFYNTTVYRAVLSLSGVAGAWLVFWLIVFRPTKSLS